MYIQCMYCHACSSNTVTPRKWGLSSHFHPLSQYCEQVILSLVHTWFSFGKHAQQHCKVSIYAQCSGTEGWQVGGRWKTTGAFRACIPRWGSRHNAGYFSLICKEGEKEEQERRSGRVGEGRTETKALNLARCDIPEKNNTVSPCCCCRCCCCCRWRKTESLWWRSHTLYRP